MEQLPEVVVAVNSWTPGVTSVMTMFEAVSGPRLVTARVISIRDGLVTVEEVILSSLFGPGGSSRQTKTSKPPFWSSAAVKWEAALVKKTSLPLLLISGGE